MEHEDEASPGARSRPALIRLGLIVAVCFFLASMLPTGLALAAFSTLLTLGALATALFAALLREPMFVRHVTRWDQASVLLALSLIAGWAVDPDAAAEAMAQIEMARAAVS